MWHGYIGQTADKDIYAKGKPYREGGGVITAKTRKELFAKMDKARKSKAAQ